MPAVGGVRLLEGVVGVWEQSTLERALAAPHDVGQEVLEAQIGQARRTPG